jgi:DNA-binding PadR family transcriptional regulator
MTDAQVVIPSVRITEQVARVLGVFLQEPQAARYGGELMQATGLKSGAMYPILRRLREAGWLSVTDEAINRKVAGREPRRLHRLTSQALAELTALSDQLRPPAA